MLGSGRSTKRGGRVLDVGMGEDVLGAHRRDATHTWTHTDMMKGSRVRVRVHASVSVPQSATAVPALPVGCRAASASAEMRIRTSIRLPGFLQAAGACSAERAGLRLRTLLAIAVQQRPRVRPRWGVHVAEGADAASNDRVGARIVGGPFSAARLRRDSARRRIGQKEPTRYAGCALDFAVAHPRARVEEARATLSQHPVGTDQSTGRKDGVLAPGVRRQHGRACPRANGCCGPWGDVMAGCRWRVLRAFRSGPWRRRYGCAKRCRSSCKA